MRKDPLYSLTPDVIAAIDEAIPDFFGPNQKDFEEDLYRRTGGGFFLQHCQVRFLGWTTHGRLHGARFAGLLAVEAAAASWSTR